MASPKSIERADKQDLLALLKEKSVFHGDFTLVSGAKSKYYVDCKMTTLDAKGAWFVGKLMHQLIRNEEAARGARIDAVGGLTMGADPLALAIAMLSYSQNDSPPLRAFSVRKTPKAHGQTKLIEGNFHKGDTVVVVDDVVTRGDSTIAALNAQSFNNSICVFPVFPMIGYLGNPLTGVIALKAGDAAEGAIINVTLFGTTHPYLLSKQGGSSVGGPSNFGPSASGSCACGIRWD